MLKNHTLIHQRQKIKGNEVTRNGTQDNPAYVLNRTKRRYESFKTKK